MEKYDIRKYIEKYIPSKQTVKRAAVTGLAALTITTATATLTGCPHANQSPGAYDSLDIDSGGGCCFPAGTKISMSDNSLKNVEDVQAGDTVISFDEENKKLVNAKVLEVESPIRDHICTISFDNGEKLDITDDHPIFTKDGWKSINPEATLKGGRYKIPVTKLEEGDEAFCINGNYMKILDIKKEMKKTQTFTLKYVDKFHNFFADNVLAHNCGGGGGGGSGGGGQ
ncbi:MAG: hypothetical protein JRD69_02705 [Deltaproteobacteria bacterium]|nr:hypothetical protein [Deltaproteobacteria bacterium]